MKIGEAARAGGVSARSLRFYEDAGLIVPGRCRNGYRDYCRPTVDRIRIIRSLLESGLPIRLIKEMLPHLADRPDAGADQLGAELLDHIRGYRDRLADRIAGLSAQRSALDAFLRDAGHTT